MLPELTYAWIFNEYPSFVHQDNRRFVSQETGNLYIAKVEASDVGNYTCVVTNTVTNSRVLGPPTPLILRNDGRACLGFFDWLLPKNNKWLKILLCRVKGEVFLLQRFREAENFCFSYGSTS